MFPTWVFGSPTGNEAGDYLAVDLGGTNLRVCLVKLLGDSKFTLTQSKFRLTEEQKQGSAGDLFDFCAQCVKDFIDSQLPQATAESPIPLGFTFSYPCYQKSIGHGVLVRWTKGFGTSGVEGNDVAQMFKDSLQKLKVPAGAPLDQRFTPSSLILLKNWRPS
jgi:hexokinase